MARKRKRKIDEPMELSEISRADREFAATFMGCDRSVLVCTTIQKMINRCEAAHWEDITPKGAAPYRWFRAPVKYLTIRTVKKEDRR